MCLFWDWAESLAAEDSAHPRVIAARLETAQLVYEAALALRDAGDLNGAYRLLSRIEATTVRRQLADQLRRAGQPVPRRTRANNTRGGLTETERSVCELVAGGARNEEIAAALGISVRTVETHLSRMYEKTGQRGRVALALWWQALGE